MSVAAAFGRAADYDRHATLQARVAAALAERIAALPLARAPRVLEIGCGTGLLGAALVPRLAGARWLMTDLSPAMVARARERFAGVPDVAFATVDGERPELAGSFDLVCSSLAAQWFADLPAALARWRTLAPGGWIAFATLAAGSFAEWRDAHADGPSGVRDYPDVAALAALGLDVSIEALTIRHAGARAFLGGLKAIGAGTPRAGHHPLPPARLRETMARFDAAGACATYAVATCIAQVPR